MGFIITENTKWITRKQAKEMYALGVGALEGLVKEGEVRRTVISPGVRKCDDTRVKHCRYSRDDIDQALDFRARGVIRRAMCAKRGRKSPFPWATKKVIDYNKQEV